LLPLVTVVTVLPFGIKGWSAGRLLGDGLAARPKAAADAPPGLKPLIVLLLRVVVAAAFSSPAALRCLAEALIAWCAASCEDDSHSSAPHSFPRFFRA
jgi:hypothetical protein